MALYLDSASLNDAQEATELGFIAGITTNPTLMAKETKTPLEQLKQLCRVSPGPVFYQLAATDKAGMIKEGLEAYTVDPQKVILKIPCNLTGLAVIAKLKGQIPCAVTAMFSVSQGWLAAQAGAKYVIPYVSRTSRLGDDPFEMIARLAEIGYGKPNKPEILAASVKSPQEAVETLEAGADHLTIPLTLIKQMAEHKWSAQTTEDFARTARGETPGTPPSSPPPPPQPQPKKPEYPDSPAGLLDYIIGKIELEEFLARSSQQELKSYLAQRELEKLLEEQEIDARLQELKKKLGKE